MPRYFFHQSDGVVFRDEIGIELADVDAARLAALAGIRSIICEEVKRGRLSIDHRIEIEDQQGRPLLTIAFEDAVKMAGRPRLQVSTVTASEKGTART